MIYHGSIVQNLKEITPKESTQKGEFVYGTPDIVTAVIFAVAMHSGKTFPPLIKLQPGHQVIAEKFENQIQAFNNMPVSIYVLDEKNFKSFKDEPTGHSSGDHIELRAEGIQKVKEEIKIDNALEFLKNNGVTLVEYKDREKVGIPKSDKYLIQGILKTYLWKIEGRQEEDYKRGDIFLEQTLNSFPKYKELTYDLIELIKKLPEKEAIGFVKNIYNKETDTFNKEAIKQAEIYLNQLYNPTITETINFKK